jgi:hypothetical protein
VLAGSGLGDHLRLAHVPGQERLAEHIVDLVGAGVGQVLAFEQEAHPEPVGEAAALGHRRGPSGVAAEQGGELGPERVGGPGLPKGGLEVVEGGDERLGDEAATEVAEAAPGSRLRPGRAEDDGLAPHRGAHVPLSAQS